jgi:hypothetical protein
MQGRGAQLQGRIRAGVEDRLVEQASSPGRTKQAQRPLCQKVAYAKGGPIVAARCAKAALCAVNISSQISL